MKKVFKYLFITLFMLSICITATSCLVDESTDESVIELVNAKKEAKEELDSYVVITDYRENEKIVIIEIIKDSKKAITNALTIEEVKTELNSAKSLIDEVKTDKELQQEELLLQLLSVKNEAKEELSTYVDLNLYRKEQASLITELLNSAYSNIDEALSKDEIDAEVENAKNLINDIKTDEELLKEELEALNQYKTTVKEELSKYVDLEAYRDAEKEEIKTILNNANSQIDKANSNEEVNQLAILAKENIDEVETSEEYLAKLPTVRTSVEDGAVYSNSKMTADFWVYSASGTKLADKNVSVTVNGVSATINWSDSTKTSYNLIFVEGENTITVVATDGKYVTTVSYNVTFNNDLSTIITVSVEGFTVGLGYFVSPYQVVLNNETLEEMASMYGYSSANDMKEALTAAYVLDYTLQIHGLTMEYQGGLSSGSSFYMSSVSGLDTSNILVPEELQYKLEENGFYVDPEIWTPGTLGEFDVTWGSGWMYQVNGSFPNVGFCDYIPQNGDVMRVQFTLAYGSDIGEEGFFGDPYFEKADRDQLTKLIAEALVQGVDVTEALEVICIMGVTQDELDAAYASLYNALNN